MSFSLRRLFIVFVVISIAVACATELLPMPHGVAFVCLVLVGCGAILFPKTWKTLLVFAPILFVAAYMLAIYLHFFSPFYYAEYNAVKRRLTALPDVKIIDSWKHVDVSLEDCSFTLQIKNRSILKIDFWEGQDWTGLFKQIDGVAFYAGNGNTHYASAADLQAKGLSIESIPDLLRNAQEFLMVARQFPLLGPQEENTVRWVYVSSE